MSAKSFIKIVVVGDDSVGKTSIISAFVAEHFPENMEEIHVPLDSDGSTLSIIDTPSDDAQRDLVFDRIAIADVVIVVYSVDRSETFERLRSYWLREITSRLHGRTMPPVIVAGNKMDMRDPADAFDASELQARAQPLLEEYPVVDSCLECSAKTQSNIKHLFSLASRAVEFPIRPLFDLSSQELTPAFRRALERIFRLFDQDRDGLLSEAELNEFQLKCFNVTLNAVELQGVRDTLRQEGTDLCLSGTCVTRAGFETLHRLFIKRNRHETAWQVLRRFGYNDELQLRLPSDRLLSGLRRRRQAKHLRCELSGKGRRFVVELFHQFKNDNEALGPQELSRLFSITNSPTSEGVFGSGPLSRVAVGDSAGEIKLQSWLALWSMLVAVDLRRALEYLHCLGFGFATDEPLVNAVTEKRREADSDFKHLSTHRCFVFGAKACGKSFMLDSFLNRNVESRAYQPTTSLRHIVRNQLMSEHHLDNNKYLVLTEVPESEAGRLAPENELADADVAIMAFDCEDEASFRFVQELQPRLPRSLPLLYVALKVDKLQSTAEPPPLLRQAAEHCQHYNLDMLSYSAFNTDHTNELLRLVAEVARFPDTLRPRTADEKRQEEAARTRRTLMVGLAVAVVVATGAGLAFWGWRNARVRSLVSQARLRSSNGGSSGSGSGRRL